MTGTTASTTSQSKLLSRFYRWLKVTLIFVVALALLLGIGLWLCTRSWFIVWILEPHLSARLGGDVQIEQASYVGDGEFIIQNLLLRSSGEEGPANLIASIAETRIKIDMRLLRRFHFRMLEVNLDQVLLRVSEDAQNPGIFNFMSLTPYWPADDKRYPAIPPRVQIRHALLEMGIHNEGHYETQGMRQVAGELYPIPDQHGWFNVELGETDVHGVGLGEEGFHLTGRWNVLTHEFNARVDRISLDEQAYEMCPDVIRSWWDRMDFEGQVAEISIERHEDQHFTLDFNIENVALNLPIETGVLWGRYRAGYIESEDVLPRMFVTRGVIRLRGDQLTLEELEGELRTSDPDSDVMPLPYSVQLTVPSLPKLDWEHKKQWMEQVLGMVPFEIVFQLDNFRLHQQDENITPAVELPLVVARIMERFHITDWNLSTNIEVTRTPPYLNAQGLLVAAPIHTKGQATVREAVGLYDKFAYPLHNVNAQLQFDDERVSVIYLNGQGPVPTDSFTSECNTSLSFNSPHDEIKQTPASVHLSGEIISPGKAAEVAIHLTASNVPLDAVLYDALNPDLQGIYETLLCQPAFENLVSSGLSDYEVHRPRIEREIRYLSNLIEQLSTKTELSDLDRTRLDNLETIRQFRQRSLDMEPFTLGGVINLNLEINRKPGLKERAVTTGTIDICRADVLFNRFPYPIRILDGYLELDVDMLSILPNANGDKILTISTLEGGMGSVSGSIDIETVPEGRLLHPHIRIFLEDITNELLYAAIPLTKEENNRLEPNQYWPGTARSRSADFLNNLSYSGLMHVVGNVDSDQTNTITYDFDVLLDEGRIRPKDNLSEFVGSAGLLWPEGFALSQVSGNLIIDNQILSLHNFHGVHNQGSIVAEGTIDFSNELPQVRLDVDFQNLTVGDYLVNLLPSERIELGRDLWNRYQPTGAFDAQLIYQAHGIDQESLQLMAHPHELIARIQDEDILIERRNGSLTVRDGIVGFHNLVLDLKRAGDSDGVLSINGSYGVPDAASDQEQLSVDGIWSQGRLDSPMIPEALRLFKAEKQADRYQEYDPLGTFDAEFMYRSPQFEQDRLYSLTVHPHDFSFHVNDTLIHAQLSEGSTILFNPDQVELQDVTGTYEGNSFSIAGSITYAPVMNLNLEFDHVGPLNNTQTRVLFPQRILSILDAIQFKDGSRTQLKDCTLRARRHQLQDETITASEEPTSELWDVDFSGHLELESASLNPGIDFSDLTGQLDIHVQHSPDEPDDMLILAHIEQMRILGNILRDSDAVLQFSDEGTHIELSEYRGDSHGGVINAQASIGIGDHRDYSVDVDMVGVALEGLITDARARKTDNSNQSIPDDSTDDLQGLVWASFSLAGQRGDIESRVGRGSARVLGDKVAHIPLVQRLVQISQLTLTMAPDLDFASMDFYVDGNHLVFEPEGILFESTVGDIANMQIIGEGLLEIDSLQLNTRFHSRGGWLLWRDVIGSLGDQLYSIHVTGPLSDPEVSIITIPGMSGNP